MSLFNPPTTPTPPTPQVQMAQNIKDAVYALVLNMLSTYGACQGYLNNTQLGITKAQVVAALGSDAAVLNTFASDMRALLVKLDAALGPRFDTLTQ